MPRYHSRGCPPPRPVGTTAAVPAPPPPARPAGAPPSRPPAGAAATAPPPPRPPRPPRPAAGAVTEVSGPPERAAVVRGAFATLSAKSEPDCVSYIFIKPLWLYETEPRYPGDHPS